MNLDGWVERLRKPHGPSIDERLSWIDDCLPRIAKVSQPWVELACQHKGIDANSSTVAEEILAGPVVVLRFLRLIQQTLQDVQRYGQPRLPGTPVKRRGGGWKIPVFPARGMYDGLLFPGIRAEVWLAPDRNGSWFGATLETLVAAARHAPPVTLVLGAGNVSAIPVTDSATKIFCEGSPVLLKLNPVNSYLHEIWEEALAPLVQADYLRIIQGDAELGAQAVAHPGIDRVHITGSHLTHDRIVWGDDPDERARRRAENKPKLEKQITSELGNVTPWMIVPGEYTSRQLRSQAEHVVASLVNNAAFNCLATRVLITCRDWPQRAQLLELVQTMLKAVPERVAYYPGARDRFARFTGQTPQDARKLPWTLLCDVPGDAESELFSEESFVCVCAETSVAAATPAEFLDRAVEFCNDRLFGTLCAVMTVPEAVRREQVHLEDAIEKLRYGTVSLNQWPGTAFGVMAPPWGAFPGSTLQDVQSGIGSVHNTFLLEECQKTVTDGPLVSVPKPVWFPTHRKADQVGWRLLELYDRLSPWRIPPLLLAALRG